ncbi:uncharacterized protein LOC111717283 [Eurytemora carolleeae]|uniref:uncharacterized protein LOC111717283 n=1 Tax=Eurytemora carolleeae TaxID=1294199 RepID=UPI000C786557|nr:uncharacterized protein LOC111717283 [Eurytemora carolleeae]|eukprot:XP_023348553.1 uncharacterized protein LOC111717283 [Eurytemora affinis]
MTSKFWVKLVQCFNHCLFQVIDLGLAVEIPAGASSVQVENVQGTEPFLAPECFTSQVVVKENKSLFLTTLTQAVDVWALGVLLLHLIPLTGDIPSPTLPINFILTRVAWNLDTIPGLSELLSSCLKMNPDERPQAKHLIKTRW